MANAKVFNNPYMANEVKQLLEAAEAAGRLGQIDLRVELIQLAKACLSTPPPQAHVVGFGTQYTRNLEGIAMVATSDQPIIDLVRMIRGDDSPEKVAQFILGLSYSTDHNVQGSIRALGGNAIALCVLSSQVFAGWVLTEEGKARMTELQIALDAVSDPFGFPPQPVL